MNVRIAIKFFVALAAMGVVVGVGSVLASQLNFRRGFLGYLNDQSLEQVEDMVPRFAAAYRQHGNWDFVVQDRRVWYQYIQPSYMNLPGRMPGPISFRPNTRPPAVVLTGLYTRIALLGPDLRWLTGNPEVTRRTPRRPILLDGHIIGYLAVLPFENVSGPADLRFQQRQYAGIWIITGGALLLAGGVALLLWRSFNRPLRRMAAVMHRLAIGEYAARLDPESAGEIGQLAEDCNELAQALERNEAMRRGFMADVSHELRTPLAVLRGTLEALEDGVCEPSRDTIVSLEGEVSTMHKLVEDLHDLSLTDVGALAYRKVMLDAGELLRLTIGAFRERMSERTLRVEYALPAQPIIVEADEARLHQLFNNLLENALRYTDPAGTIRIRIVEQDAVIIDIEDSSPGVPEESLPHLFERFYRVDPSRSRSTGGTGLGLTICRNIVEAHGGSIAAQPSTLGGLWIQVRLPKTHVDTAPWQTDPLVA